MSAASDIDTVPWLYLWVRSHPPAPPPCPPRPPPPLQAKLDTYTQMDRMHYADVEFTATVIAITRHIPATALTTALATAMPTALATALPPTVTHHPPLSPR